MDRTEPTTKTGWYWVRFRFCKIRTLQIGLYQDGEWNLVGTSKPVSADDLDVVTGPIAVPEVKREGH